MASVHGTGDEDVRSNSLVRAIAQGKDGRGLCRSNALPEERLVINLSIGVCFSYLEEILPDFEYFRIRSSEIEACIPCS